MTRELTIIDESLMEEFLSILSVGLLECVKKGIMNPLRAEQWLFSPVFAYSSWTKAYSKKFRHALDFASETDAASKCSRYQESLNENLELFYNIIKEVPKNDFEGKSFIEGLIG